jgi:hypothetical protein
MIESSLFTVITTTLDVDQLTRFNQQLSQHIQNLNAPILQEQLDPYDVVLHDSNRERFITEIDNGGNIKDLLKTLSESKPCKNLSI